MCVSFYNVCTPAWTVIDWQHCCTPWSVLTCMQISRRSFTLVLAPVMPDMLIVSKADDSVCTVTVVMLKNCRAESHVHAVCFSSDWTVLHYKMCIVFINVICSSETLLQKRFVTYLLQECVLYTVWVEKNPPPPRNFLTFFPKQLGIFSPNFTYLLNIPIYTGLQIFIQLPATLTKLCHIKRDHHNVLKMSTINRNARWVVALNMA